MSTTFGWFSILKSPIKYTILTKNTSLDWNWWRDQNLQQNLKSIYFVVTSKRNRYRIVVPKVFIFLLAIHQLSFPTLHSRHLKIQSWFVKATISDISMIGWLYYTCSLFKYWMNYQESLCTYFLYYLNIHDA